MRCDNPSCTTLGETAGQASAGSFSKITSLDSDPSLANSIGPPRPGTSPAVARSSAPTTILDVLDLTYRHVVLRTERVVVSVCWNLRSDDDPQNAAAGVDNGMNAWNIVPEDSPGRREKSLREAGDPDRRMGLAIELSQARPNGRFDFLWSREL